MIINSSLLKVSLDKSILAHVCAVVCVSVQLRNGCPVLGKNMPAVAGNLKWSQELRERILSNRSNLSQLTHM